jgi:uncharacterized protein (DUF1697 family)
MNTYLVLFRGINVGGKNKVPMAELRTCLEALGFKDVVTYIASGNVILTSDKDPQTVKATIEAALPAQFTLDSELIKVLVVTHKQLKAIVDNRPKGFGDQPDTYHSDAIFLMDLPVDRAMPIFDPREGVDAIWPGIGVVYSQRVSALRTKSRLNKIIASPLYKSMTIRSWGTIKALLRLLEASENR